VSQPVGERQDKEPVGREKEEEKKEGEHHGYQPEEKGQLETIRGIGKRKGMEVKQTAQKRRGKENQ
jgi:hypothetical protein